MCLYCSADDLRDKCSYYIRLKLTHIAHRTFLSRCNGMNGSLVRKIANTNMWRNCIFGVAWDFMRKSRAVFFLHNFLFPFRLHQQKVVIVCVCIVHACRYTLRLPLFLMYFFAYVFVIYNSYATQNTYYNLLL